MEELEYSVVLEAAAARIVGSTPTKGTTYLYKPYYTQKEYMLYECHITVSTDYTEHASRIAKNHHWKTSEIARDPVLGDRNFFYLTSHATDYIDMWTRLRTAVSSLETSGVPVIREKIELIMHDTKVKV